MDSDLSHSPQYLPQMLGTLLASDADVVIGSRYVVGASLASEWSWRRKALSGFANYYVRVLLRLGVRDVTAGFKLWRASALTAIDVASVRSNGYSFQVEMNYRTVHHGLKIVELPIHFADRREGESKMSLKVQLESALMPLVAAAPRPLVRRNQGKHHGVPTTGHRPPDSTKARPGFRPGLRFGSGGPGSASDTGADAPRSRPDLDFSVRPPRRRASSLAPARARAPRGRR